MSKCECGKEAKMIREVDEKPFCGECLEEIASWEEMGLIPKQEFLPILQEA